MSEPDDCCFGIINGSGLGTVLGIVNDKGFFCIMFFRLFLFLVSSKHVVGVACHTTTVNLVEALVQTLNRL